MKKRVLSFILIIAIVASFSISALAVDSTSKTTSTTNEFAAAKALSEKSMTELASKGYSAKEIRDIKDFREVFHEHIEDMNTLSDQALLLNGYTQEQIKVIRNFTGTDAEMLLASATLSLSVVLLNFNYDGNYSRGRLSYSWIWSGCPAMILHDMVAVSWNAWVVESQLSSVGYFHRSTGAAYTSQSATYTNDGNGTAGAAHKFNMRMGDYYYAKSGSGQFNVRSDVHAKKDFFCYVEYGHSTVWPTISFGISAGGFAGSISFSSSVTTMASKSDSYLFS